MSADQRVYLVQQGWNPMFKADDSKLFCHVANEEDGYYHRISAGELYLASGTESYCLNCALKKGIVSNERPHLRSPVPIEAN